MRMDAHPLMVAVALGLLAPGALRAADEGEDDPGSDRADADDDEAIAAAGAALARIAEGAEAHVVTLADADPEPTGRPGVPPVR